MESTRRSVHLDDGSNVFVRSLLRSEMAALQAHGFYLMSYRPPLEDPEMAEKGIVAAVSTQFAESVQETWTNRDMRRVFLGIIRETYGDLGEEKNLPTSGPGDQTKTASSTANTAETATS